MTSLYIHIPFCVKRCAYCDFYSQVADGAARRSYVRALYRHLRLLAAEGSAAEPLATLYFGGGTPSLLPVAAFRRLLGACGRLFGLTNDCEITVEANPGTVDRTYCEGLRVAGVNRLSLGIQSFDTHQLRQLGRPHTADEARQAMAAARAAGFANISLDLMFALPGQDLAELEQDIEALLEQQPEHISVYGLTFEEGTDFFRRLQAGSMTECDEDLYARQYELIRARLVAAGYEHYELSNFARPGFRCRHNQVYWQRRSCLAAGAGAHSFKDRGCGERWAVPPDVSRYLRVVGEGRDPSECLEVFDQTGAMKETLYLALRTCDGLDLQDFSRRFGCRAEEVFAPALKTLQPCLLSAPGRIALKPEKWLIYDHLVSTFL